VFVGGLVGADDLCLMSPNRGSMSIMLNICEDFSKEYDVVGHLIIYDEIRFERGNSTYSEGSTQLVLIMLILLPYATSRDI